MPIFNKKKTLIFLKPKTNTTFLCISTILRNEILRKFLLYTQYQLAAGWRHHHRDAVDDSMMMRSRSRRLAQLKVFNYLPVIYKPVQSAKGKKQAAQLLAVRRTLAKVQTAVNDLVQVDVVVLVRVVGVMGMGVHHRSQDTHKKHDFHDDGFYLNSDKEVFDIVSDSSETDSEEDNNRRDKIL
ncbi:hypothetical protein HW555_000163 [Spodoptera exigua]|uniref:Uncharacterized protein n=1 Tax=Spodoptera exigua TaxID=7107 RepID=A0A835GV05_SPOEX|nr:hypothetical protein HW555_000163 [Spodoptera exigua]